MSPLSSFNVQTTTHDENGKSIFRPNPPAPKPIAGEISIVYSVHPTLSPKNEEGRLTLANEADITGHEAAPGKSPPPGGCAVVNIVTPPGYDGGEAELHRTRTVDVGVCVSGEVELVLDSGESRILKQGDVLLHRGTMHRWINHSKTEPCLMTFFVLPAAVEGAA